MNYSLNQGQQEISDKFFEFLMGPDSEMIINGPGGVGKTYLLGYLIDKVIPQYRKMCQLMGIPAEYHDVYMTATTNKATEVLTNSIGIRAETIYAFLGLKVRDDYSTGKSVITRTNSWIIHSREIIFIDEDSMIDWELLTAIREGTNKCKIVYIGDDCQLPPVMEKISPVFTDNLPMYELTEQVRNAGQPALKAVCEQLRLTARTGEFQSIPLVPGVIDLLTGEEMEKEIHREFAQYSHTRKILAYSNQRVMDYNNFIREVRQLPPHYCVGETLINSSAIAKGNFRLHVEQEVTIVRQDPQTEMVDIIGEAELEVRSCTLEVGNRYLILDVPENREHFLKLLKYYQRVKNWAVYFQLKNSYPDLRPGDACTIYKAQGSTYDTVYIDLNNLSTCNQPHLVARQLYVAFSRARHRVVLYGELAQKYGGIRA